MQYRSAEKWRTEGKHANGYFEALAAQQVDTYSGVTLPIISFDVCKDVLVF